MTKGAAMLEIVGRVLGEAGNDVGGADASRVGR